jgi:serine/threonine protein kinase
MESTTSALQHPFIGYTPPFNWEYTGGLKNWKVKKSLQKKSEGSQASVALARCRKTRDLAVIKIFTSEVEKLLPRDISLEWDVWHHHKKENLYRGTGLVKVYDFWFETEGESAMVMEYCEEGDLFEFWNRQINVRAGAKNGYHVPNYFVAHVAAHLLNGLMYMHHGNDFDFENCTWNPPPEDWFGPVIHRDIKPENIMIRRTHRTNDKFNLPEFAIGDMGWACPLEEELRLTLEFRDLPDDVRNEAFEEKGVGTKEYRAPEDWFYGDQTLVRPQMDIYALGQTLHELMTGRLYNPSKPHTLNLSKHYKPLLVDMVTGMVDVEERRTRGIELLKLVPKLILLRDEYVAKESPLSDKSWKHWTHKTGCETHSSVALAAPGTRKSRKQTSEKKEELATTLDLAIRASGGSRKRYHRNSAGVKHNVTTMDALRMAVNPKSVVRANFLEILGGRASPLQPKRSIRDAVDQDYQRAHRRVNSLPGRVEEIVRRGAVRIHRNVDYDQSGRAIRPGRPAPRIERNDSMHFECQGVPLAMGDWSGQRHPNPERRKTLDCLLDDRPLPPSRPPREMPLRKPCPPRAVSRASSKYTDCSRCGGDSEKCDCNAQ